MTVGDPVLEVTGVPAAVVLGRIAARRRGITVPTHSATAGSHPARRLADFGDGTNEQFVRDVHQLLLGRSPTDGERERRLSELAAGATRLELIVRLALCEEGRLPRGRTVGGVGLPALLAAGRSVERASQRPALSAVSGRVVSVVRCATSPRGRRATRLLVKGGVVVAGVTVIGSRRRRARTRVAELSAQVERLQSRLAA